MRVITGGEPLIDNDEGVEAPYINISGQRTSYDYAIYVMKWLELIDPKNIKKTKYSWKNWRQDEVDHFRVEYALIILFDEMNQLRDKTIEECEAIRLFKPSAALLRPYCTLKSSDIDSR
ncbi:hypothetical protein AHAS_Ahas13G0380500 [Arachis hypogaea]